MKKVHECGRGVLYKVITLNERRRFRELMDRYNSYGYVKYAPMMRNRMDLVYAIGDDWCVLFTVHLINNFSISQKYRLDWYHTWFIRRAATVEEMKEKYGQITVEAHRCLIDYLREHGAAAVLGLSIEGRSGATYKHLGFEEIGKTVRGHGRWFLLRLR